MTYVEKAIEIRKERAKSTFNKNSATWPNDKLFAVNTNTSKKITLQLNTFQALKTIEQKNKIIKQKLFKTPEDLPSAKQHLFTIPETPEIPDIRFKKPTFKNSGFKALAEKSKDNQKQENLNGSAQQEGKKSFVGKKEILPKDKSKYIKEERSVYAILKINGKEFAISTNGKADNSLIFDFVGTATQGTGCESKTKDNFHAEDWILNSFKNSYNEYKLENEGASLNYYINNNFAKCNSNNGDAAGRHVFSLKINFSPCHGCVNTINGFKDYLTQNLGDDNFILRVKFLQPYQLKFNATNNKSQQALNFRASIEELYNNNIPVRLQPIQSAQKMLTDSKIKLTEESFKHQAISKLFAGDEDMNKIKKTWTELGRSRKNNFAINNKVNNKGNAKLLT